MWGGVGGVEGWERGGVGGGRGKGEREEVIEPADIPCCFSSTGK